MPTVYTPGLLVARATDWSCRRVLPLAGRVRVAVGDTVTAQQVIAETEMPGDAYPIPVARLLGIPAQEVADALVVPIGTRVERGAPLARVGGLFGWFPQTLAAPETGVVETVSRITGQVVLRGDPPRIGLKAYLPGVVTEVVPDLGAVISARVALIQGIFGVGGETYGRLEICSASPQDDLLPEHLTPALRGAVVVGGRRVTGETLRRAMELGVAAIIAGGLDDADLRALLGYDLGVAVTGSEKLGITVIITEGFGAIDMAQRTFGLLKEHAGQEVSVNGATQIRAGVMRPEVIIPLAKSTKGANDAPRAGQVLSPGIGVRVIREPYFGELGTVTGLPAELRWLASGAKARVVEVRLKSGQVVEVPRANVEILEGS